LLPLRQLCAFRDVDAFFFAYTLAIFQAAFVISLLFSFFS
jgi:hypothetical protein